MNMYFVEICTEDTTVAGLYSNSYYLVKAVDSASAIRTCIISDAVDEDKITATRSRKINLPNGQATRMVDESNHGTGIYMFSN